MGFLYFTGYLKKEKERQEEETIVRSFYKTH